MFHQANNTSISGGHFTVNTASTAEKGLKLLQKHVVAGALHNSAERGDSPKCHENTRVAVMEEIMAWVTASDRQPQVLWMNGPAGAGKTAIGHTIAKMCDKAGVLAASFFCSRSRPGRDEKTFLITTIVSQLIVVIPAMREHVGDALHNDFSLLSRSLEAQLEAMIVKPFELARSNTSDDADFLHSLPKLILLDGLDECGDSQSQQSVLRLILAAVSQYNLPFSFLVASRPEQKIREVFDESAVDLTVRLVLDDRYLPDDDIRIFLVTSFQNIQRRHPSHTSLPSWPPKEDIERLVLKSSGQFIYASTVIKFVDSHRHWPPDRLKIIFGILPRGKTTPFAEMDALYSHILFAASDNIDKVLDIFTVLLFLPNRHSTRPPTTEFLESFLCYRPGEVLMVLSDLHSIISMPPPSEQGHLVQFFHASLGDFLVDHSRSGEFFLDPGVGHRKIATQILKQIENGSSVGVVYIGEELAYHCIKSTPTPEFLLKLQCFDISFFWFKFGGLMGPMPIFDAVQSANDIPKFLVWLHQKLCPQWKEDNHPHLYMRNIDVWIHRHLAWVIDTSTHDIANAVLAAVTLVNFPGFQDVHHFILEVFNNVQDANANQYSCVFDQWETYIKYRQFLAEFLMDQRRSGALFVGAAQYIDLSMVLWTFLVTITSITPEKCWKAAMRAFPEILSRCGPSVELAAFLERTPLPEWPLLHTESSVHDDWITLSRTLNQTCEAYYLSISKVRTISQSIKLFFRVGIEQHRSS